MSCHSARDYLDQMIQLLPRGIAWRVAAGSVMEGLLGGLAETAARFEQRACDLQAELDPRTTSEMLAEWEQAYGLPECQHQTTLEARRRHLVAKVTSKGGCSKDYFISLARLLGYEIQIEEHPAFRAGMRCGQGCGDRHTHVWTVTIADNQVEYFRAGDRAGQPLRTWQNRELECFLRKYQPAGSLLNFGYSSGNCQADQSRITEFRAGSRAGQAVRSWPTICD
jgi:uncharacterized protein YmfQ (DUF2313 family)